MKRISLQWRITLMTALLICLTCVLINCLVGYSGMLHMDSIGAEVSAHGEVEAVSSSSFDPTSKDLDDELEQALRRVDRTVQPHVEHKQHCRCRKEKRAPLTTTA